MFSSSASLESRSNFFLGFLMLPKDKRLALSAVYAYCRHIDDIVDSGHLTKEEAGKMLHFWREEVERLYLGHPTHSISQALLKPIEQFKIPKHSFLEMIRGCSLDLEKSRYQTITDLEDYMSGVASSVGKMCVHIFGWQYTPVDRIDEFAKLFGYAFQLTNILRDVGSDLDIGRVYIPLQDLEKAGCSFETLTSRRMTPELRKVFELQYERAKNYYSNARAQIDRRDLKSLLPAEIMAAVYEAVLEKIRATGYPVLTQKTRLTTAQKIVQAAKALKYCHGC